MLNLKGIRTQLHPTQSEALWSLGHLEELVLDCDQPPEAEDGAVVTQQPSDCWGLPEFPDGMLRLRNLTHLTLSCHYALTSLPSTITKLNKLQVGSKRRASYPATCSPNTLFPRYHAIVACGFSVTTLRDPPRFLRVHMAVTISCRLVLVPWSTSFLGPSPTLCSAPLHEQSQWQQLM